MRIYQAQETLAPRNVVNVFDKLSRGMPASRTSQPTAGWVTRSSSPFLSAEYNRGIVTIQKGKRKLILNFNDLRRE